MAYHWKKVIDIILNKAKYKSTWKRQAKILLIKIFKIESEKIKKKGQIRKTWQSWGQNIDDIHSSDRMHINVM